MPLAYVRHASRMPVTITYNMTSVYISWLWERWAAIPIVCYRLEKKGWEM